eukprot:m.82362 g.82362  ORF g.82362 m.82362 type:complete len:107 (+) comp16325_c0_seq7:779-1099(+)
MMNTKTTTTAAIHAFDPLGSWSVHGTHDISSIRTSKSPTDAMHCSNRACTIKHMWCEKDQEQPPLGITGVAHGWQNTQIKRLMICRLYHVWKTSGVFAMTFDVLSI